MSLTDRVQGHYSHNTLIAMQTKIWHGNYFIMTLPVKLLHSTYKLQYRPHWSAWMACRVRTVHVTHSRMLIPRECTVLYAIIQLQK